MCHADKQNKKLKINKQSLQTDSPKVNSHHVPRFLCIETSFTVRRPHCPYVTTDQCDYTKSSRDEGSGWPILRYCVELKALAAISTSTLYGH